MSLYERMGVGLCPKRRARRMCAEAFGVEEHRLVAACRQQEIVIPRHATYYVLRRRFPEMSFPQIGRFMGGRDHSTIIHGIRAIEARMERDKVLASLVQSLVRGRLPQEQDAHVRAWLRFSCQLWDAARSSPPPAALPVEPESDLAEFIDPSRLFCAQCDRSVSGVEAARCAARLCGIRA